MTEGLEALAEMEYPGRVIIVGALSPNTMMIGYGLSGRSESSQARRLVPDCEFNTHQVRTEVTDQEQLEKGDPALLLYTAIRKEGTDMIVSNGAQTDLIAERLGQYAYLMNNRQPLSMSLPFVMSTPYLMKTKDGREIDLTGYEPDPLSTPRISGLVRGDEAILGVVKSDCEGNRVQDYFVRPLVAGKAWMIATYDGPNPADAPVPAWTGEPRELDISDINLNSLHEEVYEALGQFRVSAAVMLRKGNVRSGYSTEAKIENLHGGE